MEVFVLLRSQSQRLQNDSRARMRQNSLEKMKNYRKVEESGKKLTHPSVMKGSACFAMTWRLSSSLRKKIWPRLSIIDFTSSIVLSSNLSSRLASVMKQMNSSEAEQTDVIGSFPLFFSVVTADLMVLTSSWIVVTERDDFITRNVEKILKLMTTIQNN